MRTSLECYGVIGLSVKNLRTIWKLRIILSLGFCFEWLRYDLGTSNACFLILTYHAWNEPLFILRCFRISLKRKDIKTVFTSDFNWIISWLEYNDYPLNISQTFWLHKNMLSILVCPPPTNWYSVYFFSIKNITSNYMILKKKKKESNFPTNCWKSNWTIEQIVLFVQ